MKGRKSVPNPGGRQHSSGHNPFRHFHPPVVPATPTVPRWWFDGRFISGSTDTSSVARQLSHRRLGYRLIGASGGAPRGALSRNFHRVHRGTTRNVNPHSTSAGCICSPHMSPPGPADPAAESRGSPTWSDRRPRTRPNEESWTQPGASQRASQRTTEGRANGRARGRARERARERANGRAGERANGRARGRARERANGRARGRARRRAKRRARGTRHGSGRRPGQAHGRRIRDGRDRGANPATTRPATTRATTTRPRHHPTPPPQPTTPP